MSVRISSTPPDSPAAAPAAPFQYDPNEFEPLPGAGTASTAPASLSLAPAPSSAPAPAVSSVSPWGSKAAFSSLLKSSPIESSKPIKLNPATKPKAASTASKPDADSDSTSASTPSASSLSDPFSSSDSFSSLAAPVPTSSPIRHVVLDSGAFITGSNLTFLGPDCHYYSLSAVERELKDSESRRRYHDFPFPIDLKTPSRESIQFVTEFAKKSGDFYVLSAVDLMVLALVYEIEKGENGLKNVKLEPKTVDTEALVKAEKEKAKEKEKADEVEKDKKDDEVKDGAADGDEAETGEVEMNEPTTETQEKEDAQTAPAAKEDESKAKANDDFEGDWITPQNLHEQKEFQMAKGKSLALATSSSSVACVTTDYSMQNVLLQMGLRVLSVNGLAITSIRQWLKKCHACFALTKDLSRDFCPQCGNHTMIRVTVLVQDDGNVRYFHGNRHFNLRGTIYSIPLPKGGRHAKNLKFAEDVMTQFKARQAGHSAGAVKQSQIDQFEAAAEFGLGKQKKAQAYKDEYGYGRRNPNAGRGRRRK